MFAIPAQGGHPLNATPPEPASPEPESREQCTERQVRQCRRMAELAMQLAEAAARRMMAPADPAQKSRGPNPGLEFARFSATVRQCIKLEMRLTAPPKAPRRRTAAPKAEPKPKVQPAPEQYEEPPGTEWPFLKQYAAPHAAEAPPPEASPAEAPHARPDADAPVPTELSGSKTASPAFHPPAAVSSTPAPATPAWTPPPPQRRATDPPRPTGPNWARLFER